MSVARYKKLLVNLLPRGVAWEQVKKHPIWEALAGEYCRISDRANDLLDEIDPRTSFELLSDWEALYGIPDECTPADQDLNERRLQVIQKMAIEGSLSKAFLESIGTQLGFDITVDNIVSFKAGEGRVGGSLTNYDPPKNTMRVGTARVGEELRTFGWRHYFRAELPLTANESFRVGQNAVGDELVTYGNELLECTLKKLKPAHSGVFFTFKD